MSPRAKKYELGGHAMANDKIRGMLFFTNSFKGFLIVPRHLQLQAVLPRSDNFEWAEYKPAHKKKYYRGGKLNMCVCQRSTSRILIWP
jgi:hypothetical protein